MEMNDVLQIVAISTAIIAGSLPNFLELKKHSLPENKDQSIDKKKNHFQLTSWGIFVFILFILSLFFGVYSTIKNSQDQKNTTDSIISKANISILKSDSLKLKSDSSIKRLDSLNELALNLNDKLFNELILQQQTNKASHLLVSNMLTQQKRKAKSDINELKSTSEQIKELNNHISTLGPPSRIILSPIDSLRKIDQYIEFTTQSINLLVSQLQNDFLIRDKSFINIWILYLSSLRNIQIHLYGYAPYTLYTNWEILQENSRRFVQKIDDYMIYEPFVNNHTRDATHQLKLIKGQEFRNE